jgi:predicted nucleotidyltransferase
VGLRLCHTAHTTAPVKVILFARSRARGDGDDRSDFDFLVIEREVHDRFG